MGPFETITVPLDQSNIQKVLKTQAFNCLILVNWYGSHEAKASGMPDSPRSNPCIHSPITLPRRTSHNRIAEKLIMSFSFYDEYLCCWTGLLQMSGHVVSSM
jgi:hypothetical protein